MPVFSNSALRRYFGAPVASSGRSSVRLRGVRHAALVLLVRGRRHVGDEEVDQAVVVHVAEIRAHRGERRVRHDLSLTVGEGAVAVVVVELVGRAEVVGHVEIGPAVVVVVPPRGGMTAGFAGDAGAVGHVREGAVAVVVKQITALPVGCRPRCQQVGRDVDIEPAVAIVVAERRHDRGILHGQAVGVGLLLEGAVALVDVEQIRRVEPADIDVEQPVVVHVDERRALFPDLGRLALVADAGLLRHVLELAVAEVAKQPAALGLADDKNIRPAVAVVVADRHAGADRTRLEFLKEITAHPRVVVAILRLDAGHFRSQLDEHGLSPGAGRRVQRTDCYPCSWGR